MRNETHSTYHGHTYFFHTTHSTLPLQHTSHMICTYTLLHIKQHTKCNAKHTPYVKILLTHHITHRMQHSTQQVHTNLLAHHTTCIKSHSTHILYTSPNIDLKTAPATCTHTSLHITQFTHNTTQLSAFTTCRHTSFTSHTVTKHTKTQEHTNNTQNV